jgi:hypothetical protein
MMNEGFLVALIAASGIWLWYWSATAHERVLAISREVCRDLNLQRLDDTVALRRVTLSLTGAQLTIHRVYSFDFSTTGEDRRRAEICLKSTSLVWVRVDHPDGAILINVPDSRVD